MPTQDRPFLAPPQCGRHHFRRRREIVVAILIATLSACAREPFSPPTATARAARHATLTETAPPVAVATLLDSFSIGGVYTVLPRGGYAGGSSYARSPEKEQYAGSVRGHPTGLELPVGLPVRILTAGSYTSRQTAAIQHDYCGTSYGASDPICGVPSFTYSVHGMESGPGVLSPYEPGTGLMLAWARTAGYSEQFYGLFPAAEFFRGRVPALDTATVRELHFRRTGCCYYIPWGTTAPWETYEGGWRFGAVPDDGARAELGEAPVLQLTGPRTDTPMTVPATFTVTSTTGDSITTTRWWYVRAANNTFDGEPVPLVTITLPFTLQIPRYPDTQRTVFEELPACVGQTTCIYQASAAGAVVVQATLANGRVLAARNTGAGALAETVELEIRDTNGQRVGSNAIPPSVTEASLIGASGLNCRIQGAIRESQREFRITATRVRSGVRSPAAGLAVLLRLSADVGSDGGHRHAIGRPLGSLLPGRDSLALVVTTASDGIASGTYFAPVAGGRVIVEASANGVTVRDYFRVSVAGLVELPPNSADYMRVGATSVHPESYYGRPALLGALTELARLFRQETGRSLGFNDMSLVDGGVFDLSQDWRKPHCGHRYGVNADIQTRPLSDEQRRVLLAIWTNLGGQVLLEGDHYHFSVTR